MNHRQLVIVRFENGRVAETVEYDSAGQRVNNTGTVRESQIDKVTITLPSLPSGFYVVQGMDDYKDFALRAETHQPETAR